jgi:hypothetical protein
LVIGFWLIGVFFVGHRIYTEIVSVRRHSCVLRFSPPPSSTKLARDLQEDIQSAVAEQVMCSAATGEQYPLTSQFNKGSWCGGCEPARAHTSDLVSLGGEQASTSHGIGRAGHRFFRHSGFLQSVQIVHLH